MRRIVFYSWQSDLPNVTNREFIEQALQQAVQKITTDASVAVEPVIDRDTLGVTGSPDIASTIFAKITAADIFVADVSLINPTCEGRKTPNPNVLVELGYAYKALGHERVISVFNTAFGKVEELPFDLRMRRVITYQIAESISEHLPERNRLTDTLENALRSSLSLIPLNHTIVPNPTISGIETNQPNKIILIRKTLDELLSKLDALQPPKDSSGGTANDLLASLKLTQEPIAEFCKLCETVSVMNDMDCALEINKWFGKLYERYNEKEGYSGIISEGDFDYYKFIGHELYTSFVAFLLKEHRWNILNKVLNTVIPVKYMRPEFGPGHIKWNYFSEFISQLADESHKRNHMSIHALTLKERHTTEGLAAILPMDEFMAADFFLYLFGIIPPENIGEGYISWRPWSSLYLKRIPYFLKQAEEASIANELVQLFKVSNVEQLIQRIEERGPSLGLLYRRGFWTYPIRKGDLKNLGQYK